MVSPQLTSLYKQREILSSRVLNYEAQLSVAQARLDAVIDKISNFHKEAKK